MEELKELLTIEVLEKYVADMIIDDVKDMEEIVVNDIHIRKTHEKNYKIYKLNGEEMFFNTHYDYDTEKMKNGHNYYEFVQVVCKILRDREILDNQFSKDIIIALILFSYRNLKSTLNIYVFQEDIDNYIQQGITDKIEDIICLSQFEEELKERYSDYKFNYSPWEVIVEEEDIVDLAIPDEEWRLENEIELGDNLNEDELIVFTEGFEIDRFKIYLKNRGELTAIEELCIGFYLQHIIFQYELDYQNLIHYILEEDIESEDEEEDLIME